MAFLLHVGTEKIIHMQKDEVEKMLAYPFNNNMHCAYAICVCVSKESKCEKPWSENGKCVIRNCSSDSFPPSKVQGCKKENEKEKKRVFYISREEKPEWIYIMNGHYN